MNCDIYFTFAHYYPVMWPLFSVATCGWSYTHLWALYELSYQTCKTDFIENQMTILELFLYNRKTSVSLKPAMQFTEAKKMSLIDIPGLWLRLLANVLFKWAFNGFIYSTPTNSRVRKE